MDFTYQTENLPKLDKFNTVKINYLLNNSLAQNCKNDIHIINQNIPLSNNLVPLITSYFNVNPKIYGLVNYYYLDNVLELEIPITYDNLFNNYHLSNHLSNNHLFENYKNNELNIKKIKYYKRELIQQTISDNKMIYCYQQENKPEIQILKNYHYIEKQFIIEWKLLPYLSLFISNKITKNNEKNTNTYQNNMDVKNCQIYFIIDKRENLKLIDSHTDEINKLMKQFDKIISNFI